MKLLLIDDHVLFRDGLSLLIQHRLEWKGVGPLQVLEAGSLREAAHTLSLHPDVGLVLLDLGLSDQQGLSTLDEWRKLAPHVPVVVLSADDRQAIILAAIDRGAAGFIPKTAQAERMREAIALVLSGGVYLPPVALDATPSPAPGDTEFGDSVPDDAADPAEPVDPASTLGLSGRQLDVLRLLIEGQSNKEICRMLLLSESTVKTHLTAIFRKLKVNSRTQAVVTVARAGVTLARRP